MHEDLIARLRFGKIDDDLLAAAKEAADALEAMQLDALRYKTVRRMNAQAFAEAYKLNIATGKPFDEIIDNLQPFYDAAMKQPARR